MSTYNILQNPKYKEQFAITWKFAMNNKSVRSVRNNKARAAEASDETDADKMEVKFYDKNTVTVLCFPVPLVN